jgi:hypothetical protein
MHIIIKNIFILLAACLCTQFQRPEAGKSEREKLPVTLASLRGEYYWGDGLGSNTYLIIELNGRFSYRSFADVGYRQKYEGTIEVVEGNLLFKVEKSEPPRAQDRFPHPRLHPIRWGKRFYLLSDSQYLSFCNAVNLGLEPRDDLDGEFYVRIIRTEQSRKGEADPELDGQIDGVPELPIAWRPFLLARPLSGEIIEVQKEGQASVDIGSEKGLREGMSLMVEGKKDEAGPIHRHYGIVRVVSIEANRCSVEFTRPDFSPKFKRGQKVTSRISKEILENASRSFFWY